MIDKGLSSITGDRQKGDENMITSKLVGRFAYIKGRPGEWGVIVDYDGDWYHLAWCGDASSLLVYNRNELHVPRKAPAWASDLYNVLKNNM